MQSVTLQIRPVSNYQFLHIEQIKRMTTHQAPTDNKQPSNPQHVMHITKNSKKQIVYNVSQEPTNSSLINITPIHNENTHNLQYMT